MLRSFVVEMLGCDPLDACILVIGGDEVEVEVLGRTVRLAVDIDFEDNNLEYSVVWKCNSDRTEVSVVGRRRWEERRFDMER